MPPRKAFAALAGSTLFGFLFFGSATFAQVNPGDPSQYPPGQYPPNQYPNQYPARLPGGIPLNLPVPQIKLPQRHSKDEKKDSSTDDPKITLASAEGALRKLGEKDLLLETSKDHVLRFRLLAKTQFRDTKGEVVRDSLLHPGDRLSVQANTDDPETAVKVVLLRAGTGAEREAASASVTEAKIVTPSAEDLKKPHAVTAPDRTSDSSSEIASEDSGAGGPHPRVADPAGSAASDEVIAEARQTAASFTSELPNFLVQQATTRYRSFTGKWNWEPVDVVTADVAVVNGKEDYRNVLVNGRPPEGGAVEKTGSWSSGEFATTLTDVFDPSSRAAFVTHGSDTIAGRPAWLYNLSVKHENSHWIIVSESGSKYNPAYTGSIWIDKETHRVLRIEQRAGDLPRDFTYTKAESIVTYGFVQIDGKEHLLPVTSENSACVAGTNNCVRNVIAFRNYRKFSAESDIKYDKFASQ